MLYGQHLWTLSQKRSFCQVIPSNVGQMGGLGPAVWNGQMYRNTRIKIEKIENESAAAPFFCQRARSQLGELVECMEARSIIEPAMREHCGRALRGNLHAKLENQRNLEELVLRLQS